MDPVNRYPVFDQDLGDRSDPEGTVISLAADATDPDLDSMTWAAVRLPPGLSINPSTGLAYFPRACMYWFFSQSWFHADFLTTQSILVHARFKGLIQITKCL